MNPEQQRAYPLERLTVGRIFDRAIDLSIRNRFVLVLLAIAPILFQTLIQKLLTDAAKALATYRTTAGTLSTVAANQSIELHAVLHTYQNIGILFLVLGLLFYPLQIMSVRSVYCAYFGVTVDRGRLVSRSTKQAAGALLKCIAVGIVFFLPFILVSLIALTLIGFIGTAAGVAIIIGLGHIVPPKVVTVIIPVVSLIGVLTLILVYLSVAALTVGLWNIGILRVYIERKHITTIANELRRNLFNRAQAKRLLILGLTHLTIVTFGLLVVGLPVAIFRFFHLPWLGYVIGDVAAIPVAIVALAFRTVAFIEFRHRFENGDLDRALGECRPYAALD